MQIISVAHPSRNSKYFSNLRPDSDSPWLDEDAYTFEFVQFVLVLANHSFPWAHWKNHLWSSIDHLKSQLIAYPHCSRPCRGRRTIGKMSALRGNLARNEVDCRYSSHESKVPDTKWQPGGCCLVVKTLSEGALRRRRRSNGRPRNAGRRENP